MAYATADDFVKRYDSTVLGDIASDGCETVSEADFSDNPVLAAMLDDASGAIDAALSYGNKYIPANLAGLPQNAIDHLKRITCEIAYAYLLQRKGATNVETLKGYRELADQHLERLRKGTHIFAVPNGTEPSEMHVVGGAYQLVNPLANQTFTSQVWNYYPVQTRRNPYFYGNQ